jgi:hypothetical protein
MAEYAGWIALGALILGMFAALYVLIVERQADDPKKRGADSSPPPGGVC